MEASLRYELKNRIPELVGNIYPTNAPETSTKPYLVYMRTDTKKNKTLQGYTGNESISFMFSIMATRYGEMKSLTKKVEDFLISLPGTTIGEEGIYIQDIDIEPGAETWEKELGVNRGIINFTIYT